MADIKDNFPIKKYLYSGSILGTIAHAIAITPNPTLAHEQVWEGKNYLLYDSMGTQGVISFQEDNIIGIFCDLHSKRYSPIKQKSSDFPYFKGMPDYLFQKVQNELIQYFVGAFYGGNMPIITASFWSEGNNITACEPWPIVYENGAHLIRIQILEAEKAGVLVRLK